MGMAFAFDWEIALITWLQSMLGIVGLVFANVFSLFGEEIVLVALLIFLYWCYDKELGRIITSNICIGLVFNTMLKNMVLRRRPYMDHEEIKCLRPIKQDRDIYDVKAQGFSFPSGHSTNSMVAYGTLAKEKQEKRYRIAGIVIPLLVGLARVVAGVHYPTDVLVGWLLGISVILLMGYLEKHASNRHVAHGQLLAVGCIGVFFCRSEDYYSSLGLAMGFFLADWFEERFVGFQNTRDIKTTIFRVMGGLAVYLGTNYLLKMPFAEAFLASGRMMALLIRLIRYLIASFLTFGIYPMSFKYYEKS